MLFLLDALPTSTMRKNNCSFQPCHRHLFSVVQLRPRLPPHSSMLHGCTRVFICPTTRAAAGPAHGSDGVKGIGSESDRPGARVQHLLVVRLKYFRYLPFVHDMHSTNASYYGPLSTGKEESDCLLNGEITQKQHAFLRVWTQSQK